MSFDFGLKSRRDSSKQEIRNPKLGIRNKSEEGNRGKAQDRYFGGRFEQWRDEQEIRNPESSKSEANPKEQLEKGLKAASAAAGLNMGAAAIPLGTSRSGIFESG